MPSDDISKTARVSSRSTDNNPQSKKEVFQMDSLWTLSLKSLTERQQLMMEEMSPLFNRLHVNESDFQLFHQSFQSINASLSETIDVDQLELVLKLQQTPFNRRFLRMFDMGKIGKVDLWDFFIMTWNYCTLDREKLAHFLFESYRDDDLRTVSSFNNFTMSSNCVPDSAYISSVQLCRMAEDLHGHSLKEDSQVHGILNDVAGRLFDFKTFIAFTENHQFLLLPSFQLQQRLRQVVIGEMFWSRHTVIRKGIPQRDIIATIALMRKVQSCHQMSTEKNSPVMSNLEGGDRGLRSIAPTVHKPDPAMPQNSLFAAVLGSLTGLVYRGRRALASLGSGLSCGAFQVSERRVSTSNMAHGTSVRSKSKSGHSIMRFLSMAKKKSSGSENGRVGQSYRSPSRLSNNSLNIRSVRVTPQSDGFKSNPIFFVPPSSFTDRQDEDPYQTSTMALFRALSEETSSRVLDMDWPAGGHSPFKKSMGSTKRSTRCPSSDQSSWNDQSSASISPMVSEKASGRPLHSSSISTKSRPSTSSSIPVERLKTPSSNMSPSPSVKMKRQYHGKPSFLTTLQEMENEQIQPSLGEDEVELSINKYQKSLMSRK